MSFNSINFLLFFPIVLLINFILTKKDRKYWLLIASYFFYMCWNPKYAILLLACTGVTYLSGLFIDKAENEKLEEKAKTKKKKLIVALSVFVNLAILFYFKYTNFALSSISGLFGLFGISLNIPAFDIILPIGISFFIFQALSYTIDVYRGETKVEKDFVKYALFVSFFPQLVAGPIERSKNLLKQIDEPKDFDFARFRDGFLLMLWGFFLKIVIADRIAIFVDTVYKDYATFGGAYLIVATILFAFQIYCDFAGYSTIAIGSAKILGIDLMENFNTPYLATSVSSFWKRWHISLSSWFRDYVYIPLGGNKKGKVRTYINKFIVFLLSGLWHGANITYVIWGALNGIYQIIGDILKPVKDKIASTLKLGIVRKIFGVIFTFILIDFSWIFFRADSFTSAIEIIKSIFTTNNFNILTDGSIYNCGLEIYNFWCMIICIAILVIVDILKRNKIVVREFIARRKGIIRYVAIAIFIAVILTFGIWGSSYNAQNFIYFQF